MGYCSNPAVPFFIHYITCTVKEGGFILTLMISQMLMNANEPNEAGCSPFSLLAHLLSLNTRPVCVQLCFSSLNVHQCACASLWAGHCGA